MKPSGFLRGSVLRPHLAAAFVLSAALPMPCAADELSRQIESALNRGKKPGVFYGVHILALPDGSELYGLNAERSFKPASNMKLVTTAAAVDMLGVGFVYQTILARRGNDLLIVGSGDPATGDPQLAAKRGEDITAMFHRWAQALRAKGITEISGRLLFDDSVFDSQRTHPSWKPGDLDAWFAAPVGGLNFNDNCIDADVSPATRPGEPAVVSLTPRTESVRLENRCLSGGKGEPLIRREPGRDVLVLTGRCTKKVSVAPVAVHDPGMLFASACRMALVASGIKIGSDVRRASIRKPDGSLPEDWTVVATSTTRLPDVLVRCNKSSQNLFAECLLKTLGTRQGGAVGQADLPEGSWTTGRAAIRQFLMKVGVSPHECVVDDGSGLSHDNRLSPVHLTAVLRYMFNHAHRDVYINSLAVSGRDGTLKRRMTGIAGRVYAKTGYVAGARTLSGYVQGRDQKRWACFAILVNDIRGSTGPYADVQDEIVQLVAAWLDQQTVASGS